MEDVERDLILETLGHTLGNRTHAATILGISIRALRNKLRDYAAQGVAVPPPAAGSGGVTKHVIASARITRTVATQGDPHSRPRQVRHASPDQCPPC